jgi:hypothetical protein
MKLLLALALLLMLDACQAPRRPPSQIEPLADRPVPENPRTRERTPPLRPQRATQRENPSTGSPTTSTPSAGPLLPSALGAFMALHVTEPDLNAGDIMLGGSWIVSRSETVRGAGGARPSPRHWPRSARGSFFKHRDCQPGGCAHNACKRRIKNLKGAATPELNLNAGATHKRAAYGLSPRSETVRVPGGMRPHRRGPQSREGAHGRFHRRSR